jgi:hypothetical protein
MESLKIIPFLHSRLRANRFGASGDLRSGQSIEPVCFRTIALRRDAGHELEETLVFVEKLQANDGGWPAFVGDEQRSSWTTALAAFTLMITGRSSAQIERAVGCLLESKGREANWFWRWKFQNVDKEVKFDPAKYGWSWLPGTTSWVVPTAMSLIALRKVMRAGVVPAHLLIDRISVGTAMLLDRMCPGGGWNAGNSMAFGVSYAPHVDATSIALLALRGFEDAPGVWNSLSWLETRVAGCRSLYSLAWGLLALAAYSDRGTKAAQTLRRAGHGLTARIHDDARNVDTVTIAICALALEAVEGDNVFEVKG